MSDISLEKKLELVHQVRSQYQQNQYDLMNRENLLYGRSSRSYDMNSSAYTDGDKINSPDDQDSLFRDGTLKIRYAIVTILLLTVILLDRSDKSIAGISMERFFQMMETDYGESLAAWVDEILKPYIKPS